MYEITFIDSGLTVFWSLAQCQEHFGADEFAEIEAGYLPHIVAVKVRD